MPAATASSPSTSPTAARRWQALMCFLLIAIAMFLVDFLGITPYKAHTEAKIEVHRGVLTESLYPRKALLNEMLQGPAAPIRINITDNTHSLSSPSRWVFPAANQTKAVCAVLNDEWAKHFPHAMQQIFRCFSWWQANPHQQPVLSINTNGAYVVGFVNLLKNAFGVTVINELDGCCSHVFSDINQCCQVPLFHKGPERRPFFEMHKPQDAATLRRETLRFMQFKYHSGAVGGCPKELPNATSYLPKTLPVIGFLNRGKSRHVENHQEILETLRKSSILNQTSPNFNFLYMDSFDKSRPTGRTMYRYGTWITPFHITCLLHINCPLILQIQQEELLQPQPR
jgi:hypothetical protein